MRSNKVREHIRGDVVGPTESGRHPHVLIILKFIARKAVLALGKGGHWLHQLLEHSHVNRLLNWVLVR